jgi:ABC-2 type transport system ATP-binding protein
LTIELEGVRFSYGRVHVLCEVDWTIRRGITGLLGPNGAGKTTLLNLLVGLTKPSGGTIRHAPPGQDADAMARGRVGMLPQRFSVAGEMRVLDTVAYAGWINGVPARRSATAAKAALEAVQLDDLSRRRVRELSGGQRQRLGLAAALVHEPDVLILDEPTVGLDPGQRLRVREVIAGIGRDRTVLLSTHLIEDVSHLCSRVGVLAGGRIAFDGTEAELTILLADANVTGDDTAKGPVFGSDFERAYQRLVERLDVARD